MHRTLRLLLEPPSPVDRFGRAHQQADAANARRDWPAAERAYASALGIDTLRDDLWVQYGHAVKEQGRMAEAAAAYATAMRLAPRSADAALQAAYAYKALGQSDAAKAAFRALLAIDPEAAGARDELRALGDDAPVTPVPPPILRDVDDLPMRTLAEAAPPPQPRGWPVRRRRAAAPAARPILFFHLHKTGGLTLDDLIGDHVAPARVCPIKDDRLHLYDRATLAGFELVSAHCDVGALRLFDRPPRTVSMLREPVSRLISFYRFHRGHDLGGRHAVNTFAQLANSLSAEDFFEHEHVRQAPEVFNHYLTVFSLTYQQVRSVRPVTVDRVAEGCLDRAVARIRALDVVGIMERFDDSAALLCATLGLPPPGAIKPLNSTDAVTAKAKRTPAERVAMTPRLEAALADLVRFDQPLYAAALDEFERRLAARPNAEAAAATRPPAAPHRPGADRS